MTKRRVFILYSHPLFAKGIESLLRQAAQMEVTDLSLDEDDPLEAIRSFESDVIIIDSETQIVAQLVPSLLQQHPGLKIVSMSPRENVVTIHYQQQETVTTASDLVEIVAEGSGIAKVG